MRDFDDLSQSHHAEWLYPILFVLQPTTKFGIELCCYVSIFLWLACTVFAAAYLVSYVAGRFLAGYIGIREHGPLQPKSGG